MNEDIINKRNGSIYVINAKQSDDENKLKTKICIEIECNFL